jgi:hypothetical protein
VSGSSGKQTLTGCLTYTTTEANVRSTQNSHFTKKSEKMCFWPNMSCLAETYCIAPEDEIGALHGTLAISFISPTVCQAISRTC